MLPFRTSIIVSIIEFFSVVLLHVVYAFNQFGWEQALFISIGFLPVLLMDMERKVSLLTLISFFIQLTRCLNFFAFNASV